MAANVFISFASKDQKVAAALCSAIEKRGFSCWISSRDIEPGDNFQSAIVSAIIASKVMLLVFTANSNSSDEMTKELALASQQKLIVVPLRVEDVTPNAAFSYEFATRQWIDLFVDWEKAIDQLCERLSRAMPPETPTPAVGAPAVAAARQPAPAPKTPVGLLIGVAVAAVLAVGALIALPMLMVKKPVAQQQATAPATAPLATSAPTPTPPAPVASAAAAPAVAATPTSAEAASVPTSQAAHRPSHTELAATRTPRGGEDTHSDAYICAHGDDADYHTTEACDRKDRAGN